MFYDVRFSPVTTGVTRLTRVWVKRITRVWVTRLTRGWVTRLPLIWGTVSPVCNHPRYTQPLIVYVP